MAALVFKLKPDLSFWGPLFKERGSYIACKIAIKLESTITLTLGHNVHRIDKVLYVAHV